MSKVTNIISRAKADVQTDYNWNRAASLTIQGFRALPSASLQYAADKVPIVGWLPHYDWHWLVSDAIAGITVGLMLIPQSLSYAKIATIPVEAGLVSSWLPSLLYVFMGTSKDLSTGPTSLIGLLTAEQVEHFTSGDGAGRYTPTQVASGLALWMGVFGMILGFLNLGFLLDFISMPILSGFISAVAIVIILGQIPSLLGEDKGGESTAAKIHDLFAKLPSSNGYACAIGFTGLLFLVVIEKCGKRWSNKNKLVWFLTITRAFICLVIYTGISYAVNRKYDNSDDYIFGVAEVSSSGIPKPSMPPSSLLTQLPGRSIAIFIGSAIEHVGIARAFALKNNYVSDQTQELAYYGLTNFINSFFQTMGVGGAMSRTAVNSACRVRSPLSGIFTTAVVLICIFKLSDALYWIPKATLAAIIIAAVWPLISSPRTFYTYWKTSLADFISSMIAFWVCLFVSTAIGIASAVAFNIAYLLLRQVFTRVSHAGPDTPLTPPHTPTPSTIPPGTRIFHFNENLLFSNAHRITTSMTATIQTHHSPDPSTTTTSSSSSPSTSSRSWSVAGARRIAHLRRAAHISSPATLPPIRVAVLDFRRVNHVDATAVAQLRDFLRQLRAYGGDAVQARFVGLTREVRTRLERAGFCVVRDEEGGVGRGGVREGVVVVRVYETVGEAVVGVGRDDGVVVEGVGEKGEDDGVVSEIEVR